MSANEYDTVANVTRAVSSRLETPTVFLHEAAIITQNYLNKLSFAKFARGRRNIKFFGNRSGTKHSTRNSVLCQK